MKRLALLVLVGLAAMGGVAQAEEPFLPGQVKSQALAEWVWHPACAHVGVEPLTAAPANYLGEAHIGSCWIGLSAALIHAQARVTLQGHVAKKVRRREYELWTCTIIVHEYGHLAGYYDPVGVTQPDGSVDHLHSPDRYNVMAPEQAATYPPCRALFPRPALARRTKR